MDSSGFVPPGYKEFSGSYSYIEVRQENKKA